MKDYKVIKYPKPVDVPLTCRCVDKGGEDVYWIHDRTKTIYVCKKPWYDPTKKGNQARTCGWTYKRRRK